MARIKVIVKQTGQVGSIPEENFDDSVFQMADEPQTSNSGGLGGILKSAIVDPVVNYGKYVAQAGQSLSPTMLKSALGGELTPEETAKLAQTKTILPEEKIDTPAHILDTGARSTAGMAALVMPAGKTFKAATALGALSGAASAYGSNDNILGGILGGGVGGGGFYGGGKVLGTLLNKGGESISRKSAANLLKLTGSDVEKSIAQHGVSPTELVKKYIPAKTTYEQLIGTTAERGNGGLVNTGIKEAEDVIQETIKNTRGSNIRLIGTDITKQLKSELALMKKGIDSPSRIKALESVIAQSEKRLSNGVTPAQALELVRKANRKFGANVANPTTKEAVITASQKIEANALRNLLKDMFPSIQGALQQQEELLILKPLLNKARSNALSQGLKTGFADLSRPGTLIDPLLKNDRVASTMANIPGGKQNALTDMLKNSVKNTDSPVMSKLGMATPPGSAMQDATGMQALSRVLGGNIGKGSQQDMQTEQPSMQTEGMLEDTQQTETVGGMPRITDEMMQLAQVTLSKEALARLTELKKLQDTGGSGSANVGKVSAQNFANAKTGAESLKKVNELIFNPDGSLDQNAIIALKIPGRPNEKSRLLAAQLYNVADAYLRLRTGAQANPSEIKKLADNLEPGLTDSKKVVEEKLNVYQSVFDEITKLGQ